MARPGRPAINISSTRCQTPWQAEAEPGRIHQYLVSILALTALVSLLYHTPLPLWIRTPAALCVLVIALRQLHHARRRRIRLNHDPASTGLWTLTQAGSPTRLSGKLVKAGYRSAHLMILTIQSDDGHLHRFALWRDQLSGQAFSYLQQQLAFACEAPERPAFRQRLEQWVRIRA